MLLSTISLKLLKIYYYKSCGADTPKVWLVCCMHDWSTIALTQQSSTAKKTVPFIFNLISNEISHDAFELNKMPRFVFISAVRLLIPAWAGLWVSSADKPRHLTLTSGASSPSNSRLPFYLSAYHRWRFSLRETSTVSRSQMILAYCCVLSCPGAIEDQQFCQHVTKLKRWASTLQIILMRWDFVYR